MEQNISFDEAKSENLDCLLNKQKWSMPSIENLSLSTTEASGGVDEFDGEGFRTAS